MAQGYNPPIYYYNSQREIIPRGDMMDLDNLVSNIDDVLREIKKYESKGNKKSLMLDMNYMNLNSVFNKLLEVEEPLIQEEHQIRLQDYERQQREEEERLQREEEQRKQTMFIQKANSLLDHRLRIRVKPKLLNSQSRSSIINGIVKIMNDNRDIAYEDLEPILNHFISNYFRTQNTVTERGSGLSYKGKHHGYIRRISRMAKGL